MYQFLAQLKYFLGGQTRIQPLPMHQLTEQLKLVSITGRMAYAITCLEIIIRDEKLNEVEFQPLLDALWDFTSNPDLSDWEELIMPFIPDSEIPGQKYDYKPYQHLSQELLACIDEIIEVGRGNLYAGVRTHSPATLESTLQVVRYMLANNHPLPLIENFQRSPFTLQDQHGWGKRLNRDFFQ
ncbi:hypothetical protein GCM10023172_35430 [Hymenobacter ginsengisoli]|uniref:Uncharacterized protein n=1 Tax=Hymenobacter ginsengisoli TaxID=1051626 RepID=A0ABP8QN49_9BACT|nr:MULTISPECIES: hypothetical protein [unclassified Hymenobacter]MBO2033121.1 hypothetical protein [Hymenobacter sp. BT559]